MNKKRLLKLADFLEKEVPPGRLEMRNWQDKEFNRSDCYTAACAIGWGALIPSFKRAGFEIAPYRRAGWGIIPSPRFQGKRQMEAVKSFFDIEDRDAEDLFGSFSYPEDVTPKQVAKRIRKLVASAS